MDIALAKPAASISTGAASAGIRSEMSLRLVVTQNLTDQFQIGAGRWPRTRVMSGKPCPRVELDGILQRHGGTWRIRKADRMASQSIIRFLTV